MYNFKCILTRSSSGFWYTGLPLTVACIVPVGILREVFFPSTDAIMHWPGLKPNYELAIEWLPICDLNHWAAPPLVEMLTKSAFPRTQQRYAQCRDRTCNLLLLLCLIAVWATLPLLDLYLVFDKKKYWCGR